MEIKMKTQITLTELQQSSLELAIRTDIETSQNILEEALTDVVPDKNYIKRYRQHLKSLYAIYKKIGYDPSYLKGDK